MMMKPASAVTVNSRPLARQPQIASRPCTRSIRMRAAEPDVADAVEAAMEAPVAAEPEDDFTFNLSDARKANEFNSGDIESALRFYFEGGPEPAHNQDTVTNLGAAAEDASFFDDIDNNEAYEADEFAVAGIPEAAPKTKRGGKHRDEEEGEDDDKIAAGKQLDKFKAMEDQMVLEAAMEEEYGSDYDRDSDASYQMVAGQGVWEWLSDPTASAEAGEELSGQSLATVRRSRFDLPSDGDVMAGFTTVKADELDEQTRDLLDLIVGDEVTEGDLKSVDLSLEAAEQMPETVGLSAAAEARIDELAATPLTFLDLPDVPGALNIQVLNPTDDAQSVTQESLDEYLSALKAASSATGSMSAEEVKALFSAEGEAVEFDDEAEVEEDPEVKVLMSQAEGKIPESFDLNLTEADDLLITADEEADYDVKEFQAELRALSNMEDFSPDDLPKADQLALLEQYISSSEAFLESEDDRRTSTQQMVASGELTADVFAEDLEEIPDLEAEFAEDFSAQLAADEEDDVNTLAAYDDDEEEDGENWVERIIELQRVTKVVKGGKIMGFRCTAVIGNQNGLVGVGCRAGREVAIAVKRALVDAKKNIVLVPLVGSGTIPHKSQSKYHAAKVIIVPASDGTGVIAGSSIKSVLELAGVQNVLAKRLGCRSALNNARATVKAMQQLRTLNEVAKARGVPMSRLLLPKA